MMVTVYMTSEQVRRFLKTPNLPIQLSGSLDDAVRWVSRDDADDDDKAYVTIQVMK